MRIPRPRRRKPEFKRRTMPPPAARKLLIASTASGLILVVALAAVFIQRGLNQEAQPVVPNVTLELNTTGSTRVVVTAVTFERSLSEYAAEYHSGQTLEAAIQPLANGAVNGTLSFVDEDVDGRLSVGDAFHITYGGNDTLRIIFLPRGAIVGFWPAR